MDIICWMVEFKLLDSLFTLRARRCMAVMKGAKACRKYLSKPPENVLKATNHKFRVDNDDFLIQILVGDECIERVHNALIVRDQSSVARIESDVLLDPVHAGGRMKKIKPLQTRKQFKLTGKQMAPTRAALVSNWNSSSSSRNFPLETGEQWAARERVDSAKPCTTTAPTGQCTFDSSLFARKCPRNYCTLWHQGRALQRPPSGKRLNIDRLRDGNAFWMDGWAVKRRRFKQPFRRSWERRRCCLFKLHCSTEA